VHGGMIRGQFDQDRAQGSGVELSNERGQVVKGSLARHGIDCRFPTTPDTIASSSGPACAAAVASPECGQICCGPLGAETTAIDLTPRR